MDQAKKQKTIINVLANPQLARSIRAWRRSWPGATDTMADLAERCIERHGEEVLEGTISRRLLEQACRKQKITITDADLDQEIALAAAARLTLRADGKPDVEKWLEMNTTQQGMSVEIYRHDMVWPLVALRKLVADGVAGHGRGPPVGLRGATTGSRVRCLAIVLSDFRTAQRVWELAKQSPSKEAFGQLAAKYSVEPGSRCLMAIFPPIQMHGGQPVLEKEAFQLKQGELSGVIQLEGEVFVISLGLGQTKPVTTDIAAVRDIIREDVYEKKLRAAMEKRFTELQENATIDNFIAGTSTTPRRPPPGVDAPPGSLRPAPARAWRRGRDRLRGRPGGGQVDHPTRTAPAW